jgi:hypothetical protein
MRNQSWRMDAPLPHSAANPTMHARRPSISGTIRRGRNNDTSGQIIIAASTSSIGIREANFDVRFRERESGVPIRSDGNADA